MGKERKTEANGVRHRARDAAPESGDVFTRVVEVITDGVARIRRGSGEAGGSLWEAVLPMIQEALRGTCEDDANLVMSAKAIVVGVLRGTGEREDTALTTLTNTARGVTRLTAGMGGNLASSTKGLVLGAIASAKELGVERDKAAASAARGAREGATEEGTEASEKVRDALRESIGGVVVGIAN